MSFSPMKPSGKRQWISHTGFKEWFTWKQESYTLQAWHFIHSKKYIFFSNVGRDVEYISERGPHKGCWVLKEDHTRNVPVVFVLIWLRG